MAKLTAEKEKEREFIVECIHLYRKLPALWNVNSKIYYDREKKFKAYNTLLEKYREMFPKATKNDIKKKLNTLRTNYRKELKRQIQFLQSEADSDCGFETKCWYFNEMNFLQELEVARNSESSISTTTTAQNHEMKFENIADAEQDTESRDSILENTDDDVHEEASLTFNKNSAKEVNNEEDLMNSSYEIEHPNEKNDAYFHWAMACAADLRSMDRTQQIFAKKAIAEILMEGQLGMLHRDSVKVNESPL